MKKELNFKASSGDGTVRPFKDIDSDNPTVIQKTYRKNRKKALRAIFKDESDFCVWIPR